MYSHGFVEGGAPLLALAGDFSTLPVVGKSSRP
jgi:hypothetical protein